MPSALPPDDSLAPHASTASTAPTASAALASRSRRAALAAGIAVATAALLAPPHLAAQASPATPPAVTSPASSPSAASGAAPGATPAASTPEGKRLVVTDTSASAMGRPATVSGQSITPEDIANHMRLMGDDRTAGSVEDRRHLAQRMIAEDILMSAEAARLGVELTDRDVDDYWKNRRGSVPDYNAIAKEMGTTVERQRTLARRAALSELYLMHKVGLRSDLGERVPPDPLLVRLVTVTPSQLREAFAANKQYLGQPAAVVCDVWVCPQATDAGALEQALAAGEEPPGVTSVRRAFPVPALAQMFPPELAEFLAAAEPGAIRGAQATDGVLLIKVIERTPGQEAEFATSQESLRRMLQQELLGEARAQIVATLATQATYWPRDLFATSTAPAPTAAAGAAPATAPATPPAAAPPAGAAPSVAKPGSPP